jgi:hypothetical protein
MCTFCTYRSCINCRSEQKVGLEEFIHSLVLCQTAGPQPLLKRFLHLMRSRVSSFKSEYPLLSPRSSSNFLRFLPRLLITSIRPFILRYLSLIQFYFFQFFISPFIHCLLGALVEIAKKRLLASSCLSVCLSVCLSGCPRLSAWLPQQGFS